jgi:hypothetical protein
MGYIMDWYKTKVKYTLYTEMSDKEFRAYHNLMALTAQLEMIPTEQQMLKVCHHKTLTSLQESLKEGPRDLQGVLMKVLSDAQGVVIERERWKEHKRQQREKKRFVHMDIHEKSSPKIREDKIREDKINTLYGDIPEQWVPIFKMWIEYKQEKGQKYKSKKSAMVAYKHLVELSCDDLAKAEKIVQQSIANNWAGLFTDRNNVSDKKSKAERTIENARAALEKLDNEAVNGDINSERDYDFSIAF